MNYLRSAILAVVSTSTLVFAAGCADAPEVTDEQAPKTEIGGGSGIDPQAPSGGVCPTSSSAQEPVYYQVQASRVAKYLFGGNNPFTKDPSGFSKEYGKYGEVPPDLSVPECAKAADFWKKIAESIWENGGEKPGRSTWLGSAPNTTACGLKADLFTMQTKLFTDAQLAEYTALTDYCWGEGVSGFIATGPGAQPPGTCPSDKESKEAYAKETSAKRGGNCTPYIPGAIGFDPEPANLGKPLGSTTGSTAAATYVNSGTPVDVVEWPASYFPGPSLVPGTPCHTAPLAPGAITSKAIVALTPSSPQRRCM